MSEKEKSKLVYKIDERPPLGRSIIYGFQHIFAMILGSITGGVIIGSTVGLNSSQIGAMIGYINFAVGIATILQVGFGVKLPVIQGSTSGHIPAYLALGSIGVALYKDPLLTMQYLGGALLLGAIFEASIGMFKVLKYILRFISPITVGIVIMMVGLGLWPVINKFIGDGWLWGLAVIALVQIFSFAFGTTAKTMALFSAVIAAYVFAAVGTFAGFFPEGHALYVNFQPILEKDWITTPSFFPWGPPKFNWGFVFAMAIPYLTAAFESFGDYIAVSNSSEVKTPNIKRISRGIATEGIGSTLSSILGGTATTTFSQNIGVIRLSGVASRYVCIVAGIILILLGLIGKLGQILAEIPRVILGSVYLVAFGILIMTGLSLVLKAKVTSSRNEMIIGTALLLGLALPQYIEKNPLNFENVALQVFINVFLATPMMVGGLWAFILDNLLPGTEEERGMKGWIAEQND